MRLIDGTEFWAGSAFADANVPASRVDIDLAAFRRAFFIFLREEARRRRELTLPGLHGWGHLRTLGDITPANLVWARSDTAVRLLNFEPSFSNVPMSTIDFLEFAGWLDDTREVFRRSCVHDDAACGCGSVRDSMWSTYIDNIRDLDEFYYVALYGADDERDIDVDVSELERQFAILWGFAVAYLATFLHFDVSPPRLHGLPAEGPSELLIAPLASAPGAPPALPHLLSEGYLAA